MPPLPDRRGRAEGRARRTTKLGWHWWPEFNSINSTPVRRPPAVRPAQHLPVGLQRGRQGVDRPDPLAEGDRPGRAAHHRRPSPPDRDRRRRAWRPARPGSTATAPSTSSRRRSSSSPRTRSGRRGCCSCRRAPHHPDGLANSSGLVGKRLMMHPFANVAGPVRGAADELAGPVRRPDRVARVLRDRREARLRPRRALGPRADRRADQHGAAEPRRRAGLGPRPPHSTSRTHLGHGANWGLFAEDLPDEANHITLSSTVTDSSGIPAPEVHYRMADNSRRMLDFHIERAKESMDAAGAYKIEVDRLMRYSGWHLLGTARMGDDPKTSVLDRWNRTHDVPNLYVVDGSCFVTSSRREPDVDDRRDRPARGRPHDRDPVRAAGAGMSAEADAPLGGPLDRRRSGRRSRADRRPADPGRARDAVGGRGRRRRPAAVRAARAAGPARAAPRGAPAGARRRRRRRASTRSAGTSRPTLGALQLAIVAGYYTDSGVRELIGYPGQMAIELRSWELPGLSRGGPDRRGARPRPGVARPGDRAARRRRGRAAHLRRALVDGATASPEGGHDGRDRA